MLNLILSLGILLVSADRISEIDGKVYSLQELYGYMESKYGLSEKLNHKEVLILIDGVPYPDIEAELSKYRRSKIGQIVLFAWTRSAHWEKNWDYVIVISTKAEQLSKSKKKHLQELKTFYNDAVPNVVIKDWKCAACKVFIMDGRKISPYRARAVLNTLKLKKIAFIGVSELAVNPNMYGEGSQNGLIELYTR